MINLICTRIFGIYPKPLLWTASTSAMHASPVRAGLHAWSTQSVVSRGPPNRWVDQSVVSHGPPSRWSITVHPNGGQHGPPNRWGDQSVVSLGPPSRWSIMVHPIGGQSWSTQSVTLTPDKNAAVEHMSSEQPLMRSLDSGRRRYSALVWIHEALAPGSFFGILSRTIGCTRSTSNVYSTWRSLPNRIQHI